MAEETALDAVNAALGGEHETPPADDQVEAGAEGADESGDSAVEAGGDEDAASADDKAGEGDGGGEGKADDDKGAAGDERNPDGTFKKREAKPEDGKGGEPAKAKKEPDHVNDPIPKDLKPETQDRIRTLVKTNKEVAAERDQAKQDFDYLINGVQATGATPEQYGETLSWLALFNSNDPKQQEKALELVENVADRLATLLGKERAVGDPLKGHPDLNEAVQKGQVTKQYATEIARGRNSQTFRGTLTEQARATQNAQAQQQQELSTARTDLNTLETTLAATDPQYEAKKAMLVPILKPIFARTPPSQWKAAFEQAYQQVRIAAPARNSGVPANQPLRGNKSSPSGGSSRAPSSMLEAVSGALASMGK